jgi:hypothetical protein
MSLPALRCSPSGQPKSSGHGGASPGARCPWTFVDELPGLPTGKLLKRNAEPLLACALTFYSPSDLAMMVFITSDVPP